METHTDAETRQDLVSEPDSEWAVKVEGGDHGRADGEQDHGGDDKRVVVAHYGDKTAGAHRGDDHGDEQGEELDASLDRGITLDGLEIKGCFTPDVSTLPSP